MSDSEHRRRILIVDDNHSVHDDYKKILLPDEDDSLLEHEILFFGREFVDESISKAPACELEHAFQGKQALELLVDAIGAGQPFEMAFVDMQMPPGWDGVETVEQLWKVDPHLHVVLCTAYSRHSWTEITDRLEHSDQLLILKKPFDAIEVTQIANSLIEKRRLVLQSQRYTEQLEEQVRAQTEQIRHAHEETIHRLVAASMYRDKETGAHIRRVGLFSQVIAQTLGWSEKCSEQIRFAAPMHDVGKIGIPDAILLKPGSFNAKERAIMETHTTIGAELLSNSNSTMLQIASTIAMSHHERWDGKGYPHQLAGTDIPDVARVVTVADVYDALSNDRVYRPAFPRKDVIKMLREGEGTQFDPDMLSALLERLPEIEEIAATNPDGDWEIGGDATIELYLSRIICEANRQTITGNKLSLAPDLSC